MKSIELFAGAGGLGIGLHHAGFEPVNVIEWNHYCCDTIRENKARSVDVAVRRFSLNLIRANNAKGSIKTKRKVAGWDTGFLLEILQQK
jgi:site-specific DNA-cytosine methylase